MNLPIFHSISTPLRTGRHTKFRKLLNPVDLNSPLWTPLFLISNRRSHSQAGRRRFESGLPLQENQQLA